MRKAIRCNNRRPTPYLRRRYADMLLCGFIPQDSTAIDIACGNGRNSDFLWNMGMRDVLALDMQVDYEDALMWNANEMLPADSNNSDLILAQYLMMFLTHDEELHLCAEINRVAACGAVLIIELQKVKSARRHTSIDAVLDSLYATTHTGQYWHAQHQEKMRVTLQLHWEQRGVPARIEIGPRDVASGNLRPRR